MPPPFAQPVDAPPSFWRSPVLWMVAAACGVVVAAFAPTLSGGFLGDDFGYVGRFAGMGFSDWPRLFVREWSEGIWGMGLRELRPVTALSFIFDAHVWGANPAGFRVTNLLLHAACSTLVGMIAWRAAGRELAGGIAAAVWFALHPVHAEPVLWITGRVDVLASLFYLAAFGAFLRFRAEGGNAWLVAGVAAYAGAIFSKEFGLTLPVMLLLADVVWLRGGQTGARASAETRSNEAGGTPALPGRTGRIWTAWAPYAGCGVAATAYYFCRRAAFGAGSTDAPWPQFGSAEFWTKFAERQLTYLAHLFPPLDRWFGPQAAWATQRPVVALAVIVAAALVLFVALWFALGKARAPSSESRRPLLFFAPGWYLVATLPLVITYVSARHLYLASAGACIGAALLLRRVFRSRTGFAIAAAAVAIFFGVRLADTTGPWREAGRLSRDVVRELAVVEREAKPGAALLLDVPHDIRGAFLWEWAVPFAVRPPFTREALDAKLVVVEAMPIYFDWDRWPEQPAIAKLAQVQVESWLIQCAEGKPVRRIAIAPEKLRAAAQRFAAEKLKEDPHGAWRRFVDEVTKP